MAELLDGLIIRFPARPGYLAISRLNVTTMAAGAGFDVEELDDLRLAIDEAVTWLVGGSDDNDRDPADDPVGSDIIELQITCRPGLVQCLARRTGADGIGTDLDDLVNAILGATVDEYEVGVGDAGGRYIDLVKRSQPDG